MVYNDKKCVIWRVYMSGVFKAMAGESIVELTALTADSYLNYLDKCPWEHTKKKINLIINAYEKTSFAQW